MLAAIPFTTHLTSGPAGDGTLTQEQALQIGGRPWRTDISSRADSNTAVIANSAKEARQKKKRGGDKIVAIHRNVKVGSGWDRTRRDGKSPAKSKYGKGRGQGPPRKK